MSKRTLVLAVSNVSGTEIPPGEEQYVTFSMEGQGYGLDLTVDEYLELKGILQPYIAVADTLGGVRKASASSGGSNGTGSATGAGLDPAVVRAWARGVGMDVPEVGRLNLDIINAYQAAQGGGTQQQTQPVPL